MYEFFAKKNIPLLFFLIPLHSIQFLVAFFETMSVNHILAVLIEENIEKW